MRVLLVEDDNSFGRSVQRVLKRDGAAVDLIADGDTAERYAKAFPDAYDVILLDLTLPKKNGFEVCADLRDSKVYTPILVLSARNDSRNIVAALDNGADDYISKPFPMQELKARIRALLRRPAVQQSPKLKHGDVVLDTNTHTVWCKGRRIDLTAKEYSLLEYFMRRPDQVLTRTQIIDHVWDFAFDSFSNLIDVHIKNIRQKLKKNGCAEMITTVRGVGYRL